MVALDSMGLMEYASRRIAMAASRRRERVAKLPRTWVQALVRLTLHLAGFSCFTIAGFWLNMPAGLITAGLSCFALSYLTTRSEPSDSTMHTRR